MRKRHDPRLFRRIRLWMAALAASLRWTRHPEPQRPAPAYIRAFDSWSREIYSQYDKATSRNDLQELADKMDWNMCHYCAGPCGDCKRKFSHKPYPCDPCPQDQYGVTECTYCPYRMLRELYRLRSK